MASSKVMASTSPANPDLPLQSFIHSLPLPDLQNDPSKNLGAMNMDELLKNIYDDTEAFSGDSSDRIGGGGGGGMCLTSHGSFSLPKGVGNKSVDEVWKEIVAGSGDNREPEMTLEDFLRKAGAVREEDVRLPPVIPEYAAVDPIMSAAQFQHMQSSAVGFGNAVAGVGATAGGNLGRGKRRAVEEPPVDKATQQKQKRMIKNRESAARSRERKQAYTVELESLVTQLEEENARLLREEAELTKERFKQLMENLIPVVDKRRPPRVLRRVNSM